MPRILKRPMFRTGGTPNEGIMHGLVNRRGHDNGGSVDKHIENYYKILSKHKPPKPRLPLGQIGLNLVSGEYAGDGFLSNVARSAKDPYAQWTAADDASRNIDYETRMAATKMGISRYEADRATEIAERVRKEDAAAKVEAARLLAQNRLDVQQLKIDADVNKVTTQKLLADASPQRAFENAKDARIASAAELQAKNPYGTPKYNLYQKYPDATAEYDVYVLRALRETDDPQGKEIYANRMGKGGFIDFDIKTGKFNYETMLPGMYYYSPEYRAFVQRIPDDPQTPENEGGYFKYDKYTFEKSRLF